VGHDLFHPYSSHFFVLPFDGTNEEQREMEADYSGGQSSPFAVEPRGRNYYYYYYSFRIFSSHSGEYKEYDLLGFS
jgi:hypothetical protein